MRSIIGLVLVAFACGVAWLQTWAALPAHPAWMTGAGVIALGSWPPRATTRRHGGRCLSSPRSAYRLRLCGLARTSRMAEELPREWESVDIEIVGVVSDLPANSPQGTRFAFTVERVRTPRAVVPAQLSLAWFAPPRPATTGDEVPVVHAGERWYLTVRLKRPHGTVNPGAFDLEAWLLQQGFRATGYVHPEGLNARRDLFSARPGDYVQRARERIRDRIVAALAGAPYAGVIAALAIGDQRAIPEAQWMVFNRTGVSHLISISGLHVTVFAAFAGGIAFALARRSLRLTMRIPARNYVRPASSRWLRAAGRCRRSSGTHVRDVAVAACGLWLAVRAPPALCGCGRSPPYCCGSVGDVDTGILAVVLCRRSAVVCVDRGLRRAAPAGRPARLRDAARKARTRMVVNDWRC
jgi:competence protein ComEC